MVQSNEPSIEQMNVVIAAFEGRKFYGHTIDKFGSDTHNALPELKYHTSWSWLMPVVEKIGSQLKDHHLTIEIMSTYNSAYFWSLESGQREIANKSEPKLIDTVYAAVYQFINWFNQQLQTNETKGASDR